MSETWQRRVLFAAAAWTVFGGTAALIEARSNRRGSR